MQDYIVQHVGESITVNALAKAAGYSNWHAARVFKEVTGKSPFAYIREFRLSQAALRLRKPEPSIVDVALDFVFESHEGFTRAFTNRLACGCPRT